MGQHPAEGKQRKSGFNLIIYWQGVKHPHSALPPGLLSCLEAYLSGSLASNSYSLRDQQRAARSSCSEGRDLGQSDTRSQCMFPLKTQRNLTVNGVQMVQHKYWRFFQVKEVKEGGTFAHIHQVVVVRPLCFSGRHFRGLCLAAPHLPHLLLLLDLTRKKRRHAINDCFT